MAVYAEFFKHANFSGYSESFTLGNSSRYWWIKFGSKLRNEITSMRANAYSGFDGNVYGFTGNDFLGDYASLNMSEGWTCWWSNVGSKLNDDIESALLINRNKSEFAVELKDQIAGVFKSKLDEKLARDAGSQKRRTESLQSLLAEFRPDQEARPHRTGSEGRTRLVARLRRNHQI